MADTDFEIPADRLPPGFIETLEAAPEAPVEPRPAATIVLLRGGEAGMEVLLLRRVRSAGFVPGAYVFPGGRVDRGEASGGLVKRVAGLSPEAAAGRLDKFVGEPSALGYYIAALREAFEETGILVGIDGRKEPVPSAAQNPLFARLQDSLLADRVGFEDVLVQTHTRLNLSAVEYIAHWITPVVEPRRYDTRFFAAEVPEGTDFRLSPKEMSDGVWLTPGQALDRQKQGTLPMVFPTIKTIQALAEYDTPGAALDGFRRMDIPPILPRLIRTPTGVGLELP